MAKPVLKKETVYKVAVSIPTEGHTLPESYDNHLLHSQRTAGWESKLKYENVLVQIRDYLKDKLPEEEYTALFKKMPGIPGSFNPEQLTKIKDLKFHDVRFEIYWYTTGRLLTQMAREKLMRAALNDGMDFVIMYDDDMVLPMNMTEKLLEDMIKYPQITIVAPLAFMRSAPHYAVIYNVIEGYDGKTHKDYYINTYVKRYPKDKLVECDAVGFGAVCIRMEFVRQKMSEPYFMSTTATGEDLWFCVQAKRKGGRVFMDTRIKLGHLSNPSIIDEDFAEKWWKDNKHDLGKPELKYKAGMEGDLKTGVISHESLAVNK